MAQRLRHLRWGRLTTLGTVSGYPVFLWRYSPSEKGALKSAIEPLICRAGGPPAIGLATEPVALQNKNKHSLCLLDTLSRPRGQICLSAGIHGDEPAGVECLIHLLEKRPSWLARFDLTVFPCLNPWGYEHNVRTNERGQDLNRLWRVGAHGRAPLRKIATGSKEISLVQRALRGRRFDLTICLHEDYDATGLYIYEVVIGLPRFGRKIVKAVSRIMPIERRRQIEGRRAYGGVVVRPLESIRRRRHWPEALYHIAHHSECTLTSETPTHFPIGKRVRAHAEVVRVALKRLNGKAWTNV